MKASEQPLLEQQGTICSTFPDNPRMEQIVELMRRPPSRDEVIDDAELRLFAG